MHRVWFISLCLAFTSIFSACDLAEDDLYALHITLPENDQTFVKREDTNPYAAGMQITVGVETAERRVPLELLRLVGGAPEVIARSITVDGLATFPSVTLFPGPNRLQARDSRSGRTSLPITAYFEDPCGSISFLSPLPPDDGLLVLGPQAGGSCAQAYAIPLLASTGLRDGTRVSVLLGQRRVASGVTRGGTLSIAEVPIDERGQNLDLHLLVEGSNCEAVPFPAQVYLDCEGPRSCRITSLSNDAQLNSTDDQDPAIPGLNLDITVETDESGATQPIELVINGDLENAYRERAPVERESFAATFRNVSLPDGSLRLAATCRDQAGVITRSQVSINVDTSGCALTLASPAPGSLFVASADRGSLDVNVRAALGSDCAQVRFAESDAASCPNLKDAIFQDISLGQTSVTQSVTLSTEGDRFLCVGAVDARGNPSHVSVPIRFENHAPSLSFETFTGQLALNREGLHGAAVDGDPNTRACEYPMRVRCSREELPVTLVRIPDDVTLAQSTCLAGFATFTSVPFPSQNDGTSYQVVARSIDGNGLIGESAALEVTADCDPPVLSFPDYSCGVTALGPEDDEDPDAPGIQRAVRVVNSPNSKPQVELSVRQVTSDQTAYLTSDTHDGPYTLFAAVTFPEGVSELEACAVDPAGNRGCTGVCELMVGNVPKLQFIEPAANGQLYALDLSASGVVYRNGAPTSHDCDTDTPGLQIAVRAQVQNADPGRPARILLFTGERRLIDEVTTEVTQQNEVTACLHTEDGYGLVVRVEVDAEQVGLYGALERSVHMHSTAPSAQLSSEATPTVCRDRDTLRFLAPDNGEGPSELAFELRCADASIVTEDDWNAARPIQVAPHVEDPGLEGGTTMQWVLPSALPGSVRHCSARGYDQVGAYTPLGTSHAFESPPLKLQTAALSQLAPSLAYASTHYTITALGDVNGDGFDDLLVSGGPARALGEAALYLGSPHGLKSEPDVRFVSRDAYEFGQRAVALGNFDNDPQGLMDFAIAAPLSGRVFVVLGREHFPASEIPLDAGGCSADLCIAGPLSDELGRSLASARFNFDEVPDLVAADRKGALVVLGSGLYEPLRRLGASGTGHCLNATEQTSGDACGTGLSTPPSGFRLRSTVAIDHVVSPKRGTLYLAHDGGETDAVLWHAPKASYPQASSLVHLKSQHLVQAFKPPASRLQSQLVAVGDINADGFPDLAWSAPETQTLTLLAGDNTAAMSPWLELHNDLPAPENDAFGRRIALGLHAELGVLADFDGSGRASLLVSALETQSERGSVELFRFLTQTAHRSDRSSFFSDSTLPPADVADSYRREGQWVGDLDGDGHLDFAVLEPDFEAGLGRVIVVGTCSP